MLANAVAPQFNSNLNSGPKTEVWYAAPHSDQLASILLLFFRFISVH